MNTSMDCKNCSGTDDTRPFYIKLRQSTKLNCLYYLLPVRTQTAKNETDPKPSVGRGRPGKNVSPELSCLDDGTAKITLGDNYIFIKNYDALSFRGGYRTGTYKLLDYLVWKLDEAGSGADVSVPLADYMECCGYADTIQKRKDVRKENEARKRSSQNLGCWWST